MQVNLTQHGYQRVKERLNFKGKTAISYVQKAYDRGERICDVKSRFAKQMLCHQKQQNAEVILYDTYYFVFTKDAVLITVFPIEKSMQKALLGYRSKCNLKVA